MITPTEDARIVNVRAQLELYWANQLTAINRALWRARWTTRPPRDVFGTDYVPFTPNRMYQVQVTEPTAYAWSQIYAVHRFGLAPVNAPTPGSATVLELAWEDCSLTRLKLAISSVDDPKLFQHVLLWMSPPHYPTRGRPGWLVRPVAAFTDAPSPSTADVTDNYAARFDIREGMQIAAQVATLNLNNELDGVSAVALATVGP